LLISSDCLTGCAGNWSVRIGNKPYPFHFGQAISSGPLTLSHRVAKIAQLGWGQLCHTLAMTTKTIPAYLEEERQKDRDAQLRMEEEAARIQPLHHGHHRTAKQPKLDLPPAVKTPSRARKASAVSRKKSRPVRKTGKKIRKVA
jgi:hypothetical protein